jgi:hypothetical protein
MSRWEVTACKPSRDGGEYTPWRCCLSGHRSVPLAGWSPARRRHGHKARNPRHLPSEFSKAPARSSTLPALLEFNCGCSKAWSALIMFCEHGSRPPRRSQPGQFAAHAPIFHPGRLPQIRVSDPRALCYRPSRKRPKLRPASPIRSQERGDRDQDSGDRSQQTGISNPRFVCRLLNPVS